LNYTKAEVVFGFSDRDKEVIDKSPQLVAIHLLLMS